MLLFWLVLVPYALLLLSSFSEAQNIYGYGNEAGQTINVDIIVYGSSNCNRTNLSYYNASHSVTVDAFTVPGDVPGATMANSLTSLTFTMGVAEGPYAVPPYDQNYTTQLFWATPSPNISLQSSALPYHGCSTVISSLSRKVIVNGQGDDGDCKKLFNEECVAALISQAKDMSLAWSGQEGTSQNCSGMGYPPPACQQFGSVSRYNIPQYNLTWFSDGIGVCDEIYCEPNTSSVWIGNPYIANSGVGACEQTGSVILEENHNASRDQLLVYDNYVVTISPVLTAVWLKENRNPPWSDARLVCLRPNLFSAGSRIPSAPEMSGSPGWEQLQNFGLVWTVYLVLFGYHFILA